MPKSRQHYVDVVPRAAAAAAHDQQQQGSLPRGQVLGTVLVPQRPRTVRARPAPAKPEDVLEEVAKVINLSQAAVAEQPKDSPERRPPPPPSAPEGFKRERRRRESRPPVEQAAAWLDPEDLKVARGGRRWFPDKHNAYDAALKREARGLLLRKPQGNDFCGWQMPFPFEMGSGKVCPLCTLGECGDENCPCFRPRRPEVRESIEDIIVRMCLERFVDGPGALETYVSVGCGLLAQDLVILEKIQRAAAELRPCRAIFIDTWTSTVAVACEGSHFDPGGGGGSDLRQLGFNEPLGPEFSLSARVQFADEQDGARVFDFCSGPSADNIYIEVEQSHHGREEDQLEGLGNLVFGVRRQAHLKTVVAENCWFPGCSADYLFTISATGVFRIYVGDELLTSGHGHAPRRTLRRHLNLGRSSEEPDVLFKGQILRVRVWDHCISPSIRDGRYAGEMQRAFGQFAQWFAEDLTVWSFGSLAAYAEAVQQDSRFAADLLVRVDVHDPLEGFDEIVHEVLGSHGLALTFGGHGVSFERKGGKVREIDVECPALKAAQAEARKGWKLFGPCRSGADHGCVETHPCGQPRWPGRRRVKVVPRAQSKGPERKVVRPVKRRTASGRRA